MTGAHTGEQNRSPTPRPLSPAWWLRDRDGHLALVSWPNPALAVSLAAVVIVWAGVLTARQEEAVHWVGQGALIVWALDELLRGASPVRRVLGALVLTVQLFRLLG